MNYYDEYLDDWQQPTWDEPVPPSMPTMPDGFAEAVREQRFARVVVEGVDKSGMSRLALQWARIIAGPHHPVAAIDTDHRKLLQWAADPDTLYAPEHPWDPPFEFWHHAWIGAFDPTRLAGIAERVARDVGKRGVLVVDTLSSFWSGRGGVRDIVDNNASGWKAGNPVHREMVDALTRLPCHVIVTIRSKSDFVVPAVDSEFPTVAVQVATGVDQSNGVEFDFTLVARLDSQHDAVVCASGRSIVDGTLVSAGRTWMPAFSYRSELRLGVERITGVELDWLSAQFNRIVDQNDRKALKAVLFDEVGAMDEILFDDWPNVVGRVEALLAVYFGEPAPGDVKDDVVGPQESGQPVELTDAQADVLAAAVAELDEQPADLGDGLAGKQKDDLLAIAQTFGVEVDGRWGASRLADEIRKAMGELEPPPVEESVAASG